MIRKVAAAGLGAVVSVVTLRTVARRGGERLVAAPRTTPDEAELGGALDALGGEVVGDSVAPELTVPVASRIGVPGARFMAGRLLDAASRRIGGDPRHTEPQRMIGLLEGMPILLVSCGADSTVPLDDARRLAAAAPAKAIHWIVPGTEHSRAHATDPAGYESRVTDHLRSAFASARGTGPIIGAPEAGSPALPTQTDGPDR